MLTFSTTFLRSGVRTGLLIRKGVTNLPEKWTGRLVGKMHNERITHDDLAAELGVTKAYISMILNGRRSPDGIRNRMEAAVDRIAKKKNGPPEQVQDTV